MQQTESMAVDQPARINTLTPGHGPTPVNVPANINTMAEDLVAPMQLAFSPSSSVSPKRKATDVDVDKSDKQQQHTDKVVILEFTDNHHGIPQPITLQPQQAAEEKGGFASKPKAPAKSKTPREKAEPKAITSRKIKTPVKKTILVSTLASSHVQPSMPVENAVSPSSGADSLSPSDSHSESYVEPTTPYSTPPRHDASFYQNLASCYQAPASHTAFEAHSSSLDEQTALLTCFFGSNEC